MNGCDLTKNSTICLFKKMKCSNFAELKCFEQDKKKIFYYKDNNL